MNSRLRWTFAITSLALFAFTLDRLVVAVALPAIRADLGAQVAGLEWTVNAYTLSFAVLLLTGGALGDRFGRRRMFTIGVAVFTAGSAAAALAPTIGSLVAARAVQGVGGAIFTPLTLTMLSAVTPPGRRGAVLGAWGGIGGLGAALGPLAGGVLAGNRKAGTTRSKSAGADARFNRPADHAVLDALEKVATARGESPAQVAIAWMLSKPAVTAPILGATKASHLDDPLKAVESPLSAEEIAILEAPYAPQAVIGALTPADMAPREIRASQPRRAAA